MHGNVNEWCEDWSGPYSQAPSDGSARTKPRAAKIRRGGYWGSPAEYCQSSTRGTVGPLYPNKERGFRPAADLP